MDAIAKKAVLILKINCIPVLGQPHIQVENSETKDSANKSNVITVTITIFILRPYNA